MSILCFTRSTRKLTETSYLQHWRLGYFRTCLGSNYLQAQSVGIEKRKIPVEFGSVAVVVSWPTQVAAAGLSMGIMLTAPLKPKNAVAADEILQPEQFA